jgi:hypothetical protein
LIEEGSPSIDLTRPRSVLEVVGSALALYARYPLLFAALALAVIGPYELIVLGVTHAAPLGQQHTRASTAFILFLLDFALVAPLVSALHVNAVRLIGSGQRPKLVSVTQQGLRVLPVVAAAQIIAGLGIGLGLIALVLPGIILALRWAVVAQVAATERTDWQGALRRSRQLTANHYLHVFGVLAIASVVDYGLALGGQAIAGTGDHVGAVVLGIALVTIARSFTALATAMLFFDLLAREKLSRG